MFRVVALARPPTSCRSWTSARTPYRQEAHFARWLHWARRLYLVKAIEMYLIETDLQMADDKTKVTDRAKMLKCRAFQLNE